MEKGEITFQHYNFATSISYGHFQFKLV